MFVDDREFDYHKCGDCAVIYQYPVPSLEAIAAYYPDQYAPHQHPKIKLPSPIERSILKMCCGYTHLDTNPFLDVIAPIVRRVFKNKRIRPIQSVRYVPSGVALDIGCGSGGFLLKLEHLGWNVRGVELDEQAAEICINKGLEVFAGDLLGAKYPDDFFDLVTTHDVIEHLPNPNEVLSEVARILKPRGQLLIRTCNARALGRTWFGKYWYPDDVPRHLVLYDADNLDRAVRRYGFSAETKSSWSDIKSFLNSFDYLMGGRRTPSSRSMLRKVLAAPLHILATVLGRGDELVAIYRKK